ncbi:hypothetical protein NDU88_001992 [Pleurodeles waltl]|uniref:Uncharacterized protein n=1 Tax=Pleurodeles waltl TaxID=8319 RepID=A0AAV7SB83_PLEWA|nr:hypothetical protein NDU88_001992 [Pleurodeles waltl]
MGVDRCGRPCPWPGRVPHVFRGNRKRYLARPPMEQAPYPVTLGAAKQKLGVPHHGNRKHYLARPLASSGGAVAPP